MNKLLTAKEVAERYGVAIATLRNWHKQGVGPKRTTVGKNRVRYRLEDIEAYENQTTEKSK